MSTRNPTPDGLTVQPNAAAFGSNPAATSQELENGNFWGRYSLRTQLPNVGVINGVAVGGVNPASDPAYSKLAPGDMALVQGASPPGSSVLYVCVDRGTAAASDAEWNSVEFSPNANSIVTEPNTTRVLSESDNGATIYCTNAAGCTITVGPLLTISFRCLMVQGGAGAVTLDDSGGATTFIKPASTATPPVTSEQGATIGIEFIAAATALVYGSLG